MKRKLNNKIIIFLLFLIILSSLYIIFYKKENKNFDNKILENKIEAVLSIEENIYKTNIQENETVENFMQRLKEEKKIDFKTKTYIGMGKFIEEINGIQNNGEKYWIYYVNEKKANIGISNYKINNGDTVSWKYEKNIY